MIQMEINDNLETNFMKEAVSVLQSVRAAFAELLASLPGEISNAAVLQRTLKTSANLSWKAFKVASACTPLEAGLYVPGPSNLRALVKAAARSGVPERVISATLAAGDNFERLIAKHAGDRSVFESMIGPHAAPEDSAQINLVHRRAAFRANRHLWGTQARQHLKCVFMQPDESGDMVDVARIEGYIDLTRLHPLAPMIISLNRLTNDDGTIRQVVRQPLDPQGETEHGIAPLREFCSKPLPEFRTLKASGNYISAELANPGVGNEAAITCIEGHVTRSAVPRYRDEANLVGRNGATVRIPCESLVLDLLVREGTIGDKRPAVDIHLLQPTGQWGGVDARECDYLSANESVAYLGRGPSALQSRDTPRYVELARYVFDRLNWDKERFDVFRCQMAYPVLSSSVVMRFDLPERPAK